MRHRRTWEWGVCREACMGKKHNNTLGGSHASAAPPPALSHMPAALAPACPCPLRRP